jgi:dihydrofolate reductase
VCRGGGIGYKGDLPWPRIAKDMRYFAEMTRAPNDSSIRVAVLMGRKTWDSLPSKAKPLKDRDNIIISSSRSAVTNNNNTKVIHINRIQQLKAFEHNYDIIWIIGGASIYEQCICSDEITVSEMYITFINACYEFDTNFPEIRLHSGVDDENRDKNIAPLFDWNYTESMPPYATIGSLSLTRYSIEPIDTVSASLDCPELRFLKFNRLIQHLRP